MDARSYARNISSARLAARRQFAAHYRDRGTGLAFVPLAFTPTYSATKAALHSYTHSLRYKLKNTTTEVIEIIPPYVQTDLMNGAEDPRAMPLKNYIAETMELLKTHPPEICVKNVYGLRFAAENSKFDAVFNGLNDAMSAGH